MTTAVNPPKKEYIEDGVTLGFSAPFRFLESSDLQVSRVETDGTVTELVEGVDWSAIGGETDSGGTVTLVSSVSGATLRIRRETARSQQTDYQPSDTFPAESHEAALDRLTLVDQEQDVLIEDTATRAPLVPDGETAPDFGSLSGLQDGELLVYQGGQLTRLDRANFAGKYFAGDALGKVVPSGGTGNDAALRSDLATSGGDDLILATSGNTVGQDVEETRNNWVSVLRFIARSKWSDILDGSSASDVATEVQDAIDSGENIFFPGKSAAKYLIDGQMQISTDYQKVLGFGARLDFRGVDNTKNAIELLSTRRDTASSSVTRSGQSFGGFRILGANSASYASLIFLEEGTFFPEVHNLMSEAGTNKGYFGSLVDAFIRVNGNAASYVNDAYLHDIFLHALVQNTVLGDFPDYGIWVEGCIEGRFENIKLFYFKNCVVLGDSAGVSRNVQENLFDQVQCEPTKPTDVVDDIVGVRIYQGAENTFTNCKLDPGNGGGSSNSRAVVVSPTTAPSVPRNFTFRDCQFRGFGNTDYAIECEANAEAYGFVVDGGVFNDLAAGRVTNAGKFQIEIADNVKHFRVVPAAVKMAARQLAFAGLTVASGASDNATSVATLSDIYIPERTPVLANVNVSQNFNFLEAYRTSAEGQWKVKAYQQTGANRAIAASTLNLRPFRPDEILAQASFTVDYGSLVSGSTASTSYTVPGARLGQPIVATFYDGTGQQGILLEAYATADNTVTVARFNAHNASVDLGSGTLTISVIKPKFDLAGGVVYDISAVAAGARATTSVSIPGVQPGDNLLAWYSINQEGCFIRPRMTAAADTVNFEIINPTGSTPAGSPSALIYCGVYRNPSVM